MPVTEIDNATTFMSEISNATDVVVKFEAEWCGPCKAVKPVVEEVAKQNPTVKFLSVDIDGDGIADVVMEYGIRSVPAFIRLKNGQRINSAVGTISKKELSSFVSE